jgi:hypothetical protein
MGLFDGQTSGKDARVEAACLLHRFGDFNVDSTKITRSFTERFLAEVEPMKRQQPWFRGWLNGVMAIAILAGLAFTAIFFRFWCGWLMVYMFGCGIEGGFVVSTEGFVDKHRSDRTIPGCSGFAVALNKATGN